MNKGNLTGAEEPDRSAVEWTHFGSHCDYCRNPHFAGLKCPQCGGSKINMNRLIEDVRQAGRVEVAGSQPPEPVMSEDRDRAAFIAFLTANGYDATVYGDGNFADEVIDMERAWNAALTWAASLCPSEDKRNTE